MKRTIAHWMGFGLMLVLAMGCQPQLIRGTQVRATSENLEIVRVIRQYERAISAGQWKKLLPLVSPRFRETKGTPENNNDDYGYTQLRQKLEAYAKRKIRVLKFEVEVQNIEFTKTNRARVYVLKKYALLVPRGKYRPKFDTGSILQMMVLEYQQGQWRFVRW